HLKRAGYANLVAAAAKGASPEGARKAAALLDAKERVLETLTEAPAWLRDGAKAVKKAPPSWVKPDALPDLEVAGKKLAPEHVLAVVAALAASALDAPHPLVAGVKANATSASRDAFAWKLFLAWLAEGAASKDKW